MTRFLLLSLLLSLALGGGFAAPGHCQTELKFKQDFLRRLVAMVPGIIKSQDAKTGRFGKGLWVCRDQHPIYPLAVVWATRSDDNPYCHDPRVLDAIMAGGDALIEAADATGKWRFDKKDGSFWGMTYMPWTYSRWIRAFGLIRDAMPPDRRERWEKALTLGYDGIAKTCLGHLHNIPAHHAMGLYLAGQVLNKPEWSKQATEFMATVVAAQDVGGFWSEHFGPVVSYNFVYSDAIGTYYAMSKDAAVLPALERAAKFHAAFTYPDGVMVETVDERNPYAATHLPLGNVGFSFSPEGRGYLARQMELMKRAGRAISQDDLASFILYGQEGPTVPTAAEDRDHTFVLGKNDALVRRTGPWFICISAYHCPPPTNRWQQDRQNLVSIYHDRCGLIIGGGNSKLQPLWSNFTVGDVSLLKHKPGDENPHFTPDIPLHWFPDAAKLKSSDPPGIALTYGKERCAIDVEPVDERRLNIRLRASARSGEPVAAHITLIPHLDKPLRFESGIEKNLAKGILSLSKDTFTLSASEAGKWIEHAGWRLSLPDGATVTWPVLPHNPYVKDGAATLAEGRIMVTVPFSKDAGERTVGIEMTNP